MIYQILLLSVELTGSFQQSKMEKSIEMRVTCSKDRRQFTQHVSIPATTADGTTGVMPQNGSGYESLASVLLTKQQEVASAAPSLQDLQDHLLGGNPDNGSLIAFQESSRLGVTGNAVSQIESQFSHQFKTLKSEPSKIFLDLEVIHPRLSVEGQANVKVELPSALSVSAGEDIIDSLRKHTHTH